MRSQAFNRSTLLVLGALACACDSESGVAPDGAFDAQVDLASDLSRPIAAAINADLTLNDLGARDRPDAALRDVGVAEANDAAAAPDTAVPWGLDTRPRNTSCVAFARPSAGAGASLTPMFPSLPPFASVTTLVQSPGDGSRWFVTEQAGRVRVFANTPTVSTSSTFVDITARVVFNGEMGLLGIAFHPNFATNGQVFLSYTGPRRPGVSETVVSRVSRFRSRDGGRTLDPGSEEPVLEISQPFQNHKGGNIVFGPDGFLYAGFGDGGGAGDPMRNGQNLNTLLSKMVRIDVDRPTGGRAYGIPADNPFADGRGGRAEIFAWGLRNPWRWSFDRATGELWAGDVGQDAIEEVDVVRRGGNYGWNVMEGDQCYNAPTCDRASLTLPVLQLDHTLSRSITGGYVYRGRRIPSFTGSFVFGDFLNGQLWHTGHDAAGRVTADYLLHVPGGYISTFGEDTDGELYIVSYGEGRIFRLDPGPTTPIDTVPPTIRATGCVDLTNPLAPATGLIPYAPNAPFWSDGAEKERFMALPEDARISVNADGDWDLPVGTVLVKNFAVGGRRIETRLFVHHADGDWGGYSYRWNDAQTDAAALVGSDARDLGGGVRWLFPNRGQCLECHTQAAGRSLGLETAQLNGDLTYAATGRVANQLTTLEHIGAFAAPLGAPAAMLPRYPSPSGSAPLHLRARAYLHTNCAQCHRPGGSGRGPANLLFSTPASMLGVCDVAPTAGDLGVANARLLAPGAPARSILSVRTHATNAWRMPAVSSNVVDTAGTALIDAWITSLRACP